MMLQLLQEREVMPASHIHTIGANGKYLEQVRNWVIWGQKVGQGARWKQN